MKCVCFLLFLLLLTKSAFADDFLVQLPNGIISGREDASYTGKPYYHFQKIPYAAPPVGNLRFQPPVPPQNWDDILNTTYLDAICYQITTNLPEETEDCLYINVYTPQLQNETGHVSIPVLLYIYGGGFHEGHAMQYRRGPEYLIDHDVVIVTFNYRLGPFGFISTEDDILPGNLGLKDQQLAIQWVHDNIHLFGGDPDKVTIVGESAGGASVGFHLLNEHFTGLFRGAIMESGTAINPWVIQRNAREIAFQFGEVLNSSSANDSQLLLDYLLTLSAEDLDFASTVVSDWAPVIDGDVIPGKMYGLIQSGQFVKVPILMGINSEEAISTAADLDALREKLEYDDNHLQDLVPEDMNLKNEDIQIIFGHAIRTIYCEGGNLSDNLAAGVRYASDNNFTRAAIRCGQLKSNFTDVFFYQFSYDGILGNGTVSLNGTEHVGHAEELRYIWRTTRDGYDNSDLSKFPPQDVLTQHRMLTLWTNFVKTLNPTPEPIDLLQNITWLTVTSGEPGDFLYLDISEELVARNHPKNETFDKWVQLYDVLPFEDFDTY